MSRSARRRWAGRIGPVAGLWLAAGLACEPAPPVEPIDAASSDMAPEPADGRAPDMALDAMADLGPDAMPDAAADGPLAAADAMPDVMPDAMVDAMRHAIADAGLDAMIDAMSDMTADAMNDGAVDAGRDADSLDGGPQDVAPLDRGVPIWDAALDQALDAVADQAMDQALDAEPDMAPFEGPARSDDFEAGPLGRSWQLFNPQLFEHAVRDGALWMTPRVFGLWFDRNTGPMIYQSVTGDFRVTARVRARRASALDEPPDQAVHLGGLMARDPRTPPENYVFVVVGRDIDDLSVETKTTEAGRSVFEGPMWPHGSDAELRLCRLGADFHMYKRPIDGGEWALAATFERPDLPPTLQVGAIAYTNSREPDLSVGFEEIHFADVFEEADCLADPIE